MASYELVFSVEPMHCGGCVADINSLLSQFKFKDKYLSYSISLEDKTLTCYVDDTENSQEDVSSRLSTVLEDYLDRTLRLETLSLKSLPSHEIPAAIGLVMGFFWISLAFGWLAMPLIAHQCLVAFSSGLLIYIAWPFVKSAWNALFSRKSKLNMDSLFVLTGLIVLASSIASLFFPIFPCLLSSGLMIFGFRHLGCMFQVYLDKKMGFYRLMVNEFRRKIYLEAEKNPKSAHLFKKGELIVCKTGDIIPIDGKVHACTEGTVLVDELKNGQYFGTDLVATGREVLAGGRVQSGEVTLEVDKPLNISRLAEMDQLMRDLQSEKGQAKILKKSEQWLQWFIPVLLVLALGSGLWVGQVYGLALAIQCVASILVSACPCTLGLIIPMALRMGAYKASIHGVEFKSSEALEYAADSSIFVLDYNGTLTEGKPTVSCSSELSSEYLNVIRLLEAEMLRVRPTQIIGQAVMAFVDEKLRGESIPEVALTEFSWVKSGGGASGRIDGHQWHFGNQQLLRSIGLYPDNPEPFQHYLVRDREIIATLTVKDELKPDAKSFVNKLKQDGKIVKICTGADESTGAFIAKVLGFAAEDIKAAQTEKTKPDFIKALKKQYPRQVLAMLGDNLNDDPALRASDLSIWVKNTHLSTEFRPVIQGVANIEIEGNKLSDIHTAFIIAKQTLSLIHQNLVISLAYNLIVLGVACGALLAFGLSMPAALGVCLMILQSGILALNVYRVLSKPIHTESDNSQDLTRNSLMATCPQSSII